MRTRIAGGLFVSHLRSETDLKSQNKTSPVIEEVEYYAGELLRLYEHRQGVLEEILKFVDFTLPIKSILCWEDGHEIPILLTCWSR